MIFFIIESILKSRLRINHFFDLIHYKFPIQLNNNGTDIVSSYNNNRRGSSLAAAALAASSSRGKSLLFTLFLISEDENPLEFRLINRGGLLITTLPHQPISLPTPLALENSLLVFSTFAI